MKNGVKKWHYTLIGTLSLFFCLSIVLIYMRPLDDVVIISADSNRSVTLRGGRSDGEWYGNEYLVCQAGNWQFGEQSTYTSIDNTPLTIKFPDGGMQCLTFDVGPMQGKVKIQKGYDSAIIDLYADCVVEYGREYNIQELFWNGRNMIPKKYCLLASIGVIATIIFVLGFLNFLFSHKRNAKYMLIFSVGVLVIFVAQFCVLERKDSITKNKKFLEQSENIDVYFLGSSHVINGVYPMEMYDEYGITSYNFGSHNGMIPTSYWILRNALDYHQPKVVVLDCALVEKNVKISPQFEHVHDSLDAFPLSRTKFLSAIDFTKDIEAKNGIDRNGEIVFDYLIYHARWEDLKKEDFENNNSLYYGANARVMVSRLCNEDCETDSKLEYVTLGQFYLEKIIEECQERGITVLLTYLPCAITEDKLIAANTIYDVADKYNVEYLNFMELNVVDSETDFYDSFSHLNPAGAKKISHYLGACLKKKYGLEDHRNDEKYKKWNEDCNAYKASKVQLINSQSDLNVSLMLLLDDDYKVDVSINDDQILEDEVTFHLLDCIGANNSEIIDEMSELPSDEKKDEELSDIIIHVFDRENPEKRLTTVSFSMIDESNPNIRVKDNYGNTLLSANAHKDN